MRVPRYIPPEDIGLSAEGVDRFLDDLVAREERYVPPFWTPEYVSVRMVEAADVIRRAQLRIGPSALKAQQIAYNHDDIDGNEKLALNRFWIEMHIVHALPPAPTRAEMQRADYVLRWPARFIKDDPDMAACTSAWAHWTACEVDVSAMADQCYVERSRGFDAKKNEGLRRIAAGLNAAKEAPT